MSLDTRALLDAARSHAMRIGNAERVLLHEPTNTPGPGITVAMWPGPVRPIQKSGLAAVSVLAVIVIRLYGALEQVPPSDEMDVDLIDATDALLNAYAGDLNLGLGDLVRSVDVLGAEGVPLSSQPGYLEMSENEVCRVVDINLPLILNDVWNLEA